MLPVLLLVVFIGKIHLLHQISSSLCSLQNEKSDLYCLHLLWWVHLHTRIYVMVIWYKEK